MDFCKLNHTPNGLIVAASVQGAGCNNNSNNNSNNNFSPMLSMVICEGLIVLKERVRH
jgi:hypothetical protein